MESHLRAAHVAFWNRLMPGLMARRDEWLAGGGARQPSAAVVWTLAVACVILLGVVGVLTAVQVRHSMIARRTRGAPAAAAAGCKLVVGTAGEKQVNNSGTC